VNTRIVSLTALACIMLVMLVLVSVVARGATQSHDRRPGEQLVVRNIVAGQDITSHEWGMVRLEVGIEKKGSPASGKKMRSRRSPLKIKVDDKEVNCYVVSSSTGYEGKNTYAYKTVAIRLGSEPGPKIITVFHDGLVKSIPINYSPSGQLELTDLFDHQAIFGKNPVTIHWFGCYLARESVKVSINGKSLPPEMETPPDAPELLAGRISPGELLAPGANKLKIEAVDIKGAKQKREIVFQYYPENRVPMGDEFAIKLGLEEPQNGPFHEVAVQGKSILETHEVGLRPGPERMGGQTVVPPGKVLLAWFKAVRPGGSDIATKVKQYAADNAKEIEKAHVAVYATAGELSETESALGMERYLAQDLFACALPGAWVKAENPDSEKSIFGVSLYEKSPQDWSAARVSIEFYSPNSDAGKAGAQGYIDGLLKEGQPERGLEERTLIAWVLKAFDDVGKKVKSILHNGEPEKTLPPVARLMDATIGGKQAKVVERDAFFVETKAVVLRNRVPLIERFVVVPAEAGFYVLSFTSPASGAEKNRELFTAIQASFTPLK